MLRRRSRDSYDVGKYHGTNGGLGAPGDNNIASIVVPQGLSANVCSTISATGGGTGSCTTLTRTSFALPAGIANALSYMNVAPVPMSTAQLVVTRTGTIGQVVSMPLGIDCPGDCSGAYLARSEVRLRSVPASNDVEWTGCDRITNNDCFVSMTGTQHVSFYVPAFDGECYQDCVAQCDFVGQQCIDECHADCTL